MFHLDWVVCAKTAKNCSFKPFLWLFWQGLDYFRREKSRGREFFKEKITGQRDFLKKKNHGQRIFLRWLFSAFIESGCPAPVAEPSKTKSFFSWSLGKFNKCVTKYIFFAPCFYSDVCASRLVNHAFALVSLVCVYSGSCLHPLFWLMCHKKYAKNVSGSFFRKS